MKNIFKINATLLLGILLLFLGLTYFIYFDFSVLDSSTYFSLDSDSYLSVAKDLHIDSIRTIGYPFFLYLIEKISPANYFYFNVFVIQYVLLICSFLLLYSIASFYTNKKIAFIAIIILALNPSFISYTHLILAEIFTLFLLTSSCYFLFLFLQSKQVFNLLFSITVLSLATLVRPGLYYFNILMLIILVFYFIKIQTKLIYYLLLICQASICLGVPIYLFHQKYNLSKLSIIDTITMYRYQQVNTIAIAEQKSIQEVMSEKDTLLNKKITMPIKEFNNFCSQESKATFEKYPKASLYSYISNLISNTHNGNSYYSNPNKKKQRLVFDISRIYCMANTSILLISSLFFLIILFRNYKNINYTMLFALLLANYIFFTSGISFWQGDRFSILFLPFVYLSLILFFSKKRLETHFKNPAIQS